MSILRQTLAFVLVLSLSFPAFGESTSIGQAIGSQDATLRNLPLKPGSTLYSDDVVSVGDQGDAQIAVTGGGQIEVLEHSDVRFERANSAVQLYVQTGAASFRSQPGSAVEAVIADATIRSAKGLPAFATIGMESPDSAIVVARKGALEITTLHDANTLLVPEGSAARITLVPDPQQQGGNAPVALPAGKGLGGWSEKKKALVALLIGGGLITLGAILATEHHKPRIEEINEVSPFTLPPS